MARVRSIRPSNQATASISGASAAFGWRSKIKSIRHALTLLGERSIRKWVSLVALTSLAGDKPAELIAVDAQMPEHKHGMNYRPTIVSMGDGRYRVEGMVFHMPGRWEISIDVRAGEESERLSHEFILK